jgi:hypothetical protein
MSEKKRSMTQTLTGFSKGFSTGTALKLWLFFLFCFYFLGYPVPLSILLGFAGGLASGLVIGWWNTKDEPADLKPAKVEELEESSPRVSGLRSAKQRRDGRTKNRSPGLVTPFNGFFQKRDKSSKKSRRKVTQSDDDA